MNTLERNLLMLLLVAGIYLVGLTLASAMVLADLSYWQPEIYITGALSAYLAWRSICWPDKLARYISFGATLLLIFSASHVLFLIDFLVNDSDLSIGPIYTESTERDLLIGDALSFYGMLVTIGVWGALGGFKMGVGNKFDGLRKASKQLGFLYSIALSALVLSRSVGDAAQALGQLIPILLLLGLISSYLISEILLMNKIVRPPVCLVLSAPFIYWSLDSGMKEDIILSLLPTLIHLWRISSAVVYRVSAIIGVMVLVGVISSYVQFYRDTVWSGGESISIGSAVKVFIEERSSTEGADRKGGLQFVSRTNASYHRGWAISAAHEYGYQPELVLYPLLYVFIPRLVWPEKPEIRTGWNYSGLIFGLDYISWSASSTAAGFYPSLYLGGGALVTAFGAVLAGLIIVGCTVVMERIGGDVGVALYVGILFRIALRFEESWPDGGFAGPVISLIYLILILLFINMFLPKVGMFHRFREVEK